MQSSLCFWLLTWTSVRPKLSTHLHLWELPSLFPVLLWYLHQYQYLDLLNLTPWIWNLPPNNLLLCSHCLHHPEHQLHHRQEQGLLHLLLHLMAVILFFGSRYASLSHAFLWFLLDLLSSLQYSVITPMLNPLIYSFKNKEVKKGAVKRTLGKYLHYCTGWTKSFTQHTWKD